MSRYVCRSSFCLGLRGICLSAAVLSVGCVGLLFRDHGTLSPHFNSPPSIAESTSFLTVPEGERIVLELRTRLSTTASRVGESCEFVTFHDVFLGLQHRLSLPARTRVRGKVQQVRSGRLLLWGPSIKFSLEELLLADGSRVPFFAIPERVHGPLAREGLELRMDPGLLVEAVVTRDLQIPLQPRALERWAPGPAAWPGKWDAPGRDRTMQGFDNQTTLAEGAEFAVPKALEPVADAETDLRLVSRVDRVLVEAVVRRADGRLIEDLQKSDFRILEEGREVRLEEFAKLLRPLALALVVDGSGSISPFQEELRQSARTALSALSPDDLASLFVFATDVERQLDLTDTFDSISEAIGEIVPAGRTNLYDAVAFAADYLGRAAPGMQHAVILISDNWPNRIGQSGEGTAIRLAIETGTIVFSLKLPGTAVPPARWLKEPVWFGGQDTVERIVAATGGEVFSVSQSRMLSTALSSILEALKRSYLLSFVPADSNGNRFRRISVGLDRRFGKGGRDYTIAARSGYYPVPPG